MKSILATVLTLAITIWDAETASLPGLPATAGTQAPRPNIIFILADDLGLDDVGCCGSDIHKTPNVDRLASSGLRFETCYSAPLCGPTRGLLMTGRYAFRTGALRNNSWRNGGPGPKAAAENPMAKILKSAGYATGMAGKWRQVGETPREWGFDEYTTDPQAGGWYWQREHQQNGKVITVPEGTYAGDVVHEFAIDFLRRHKEGPFFFYYPMHHVHTPIQRTPDTATHGTGNLYEDNIRYMDKQIGAVIAELEKLGIRDRTLVMFAGDNGTALNYPSPIGGRMINGRKGSLLEGGARVPCIASWPGVTPAGKVCKDLVDFSDPLVTFAELAGAKLPAGFKYDGHSFAAQLRGQAGTPRPWAYVQLGERWYVREPGFKLNQRGELFDMADAPFVEKLVEPADDTKASQAARARLDAALKELNPGAGKVDNGPADGDGKAGKKKKKKAAAAAETE